MNKMPNAMTEPIRLILVKRYASVKAPTCRYQAFKQWWFDASAAKHTQHYNRKTFVERPVLVVGKLD